MKLYRSDQASIGVTVAGIPIDNESWDVLDAGDAEVDNLKVAPGGMAPYLDLGGIPKPSNLTVARLWSDTLIVVFKQLYNVAGQAPVTVTYTVLEPNRTASALPPLTYTGTLGTVTRPNYKAGASEEAMLQITVGLNAQIS